MMLSMLFFFVPMNPPLFPFWTVSVSNGFRIYVWPRLLLRRGLFA